jgi:hypothetical protein
MTLHSGIHPRIGRNRLIRPAAALAVLVLAACSSTASRTESSAIPTAAAQQSAALAAKTVPTAAPTATPGSSQPGSATSAALRPCVARPAQVDDGCGPCPPVLAGPLPLLRCPPALPKPPLPPTSLARISFCVGLPPIKSGPAAIPVMQPAVCGSGFGPFEVVTLTLTSLRGKISWSTIAGRTGTFDSPLPTSSCLLAPAQLVAHGNTGHASNALSLSPTLCRPRL